MPKRGSSTPGLMTARLRKKSKNAKSENGDNDEEHNENLPIKSNTCLSQLFKKNPDVNIFT